MTNQEKRDEIAHAIRRAVNNQFYGSSVNDKLSEIEAIAEEIYDSFEIYKRPYGTKPKIQIQGYDIEVVW